MSHSSSPESEPLPWGAPVDVAVVTRQFAVRWGGAEHSIAEVVAALAAARPGLRWSVGDGGFDPPGTLRRLPLLALTRDAGRLRAAARAANARLVLAQSLVAPALLTALPPGVAGVYFLRDVAYWHHWPNHESGRRWWAKAAYQAAMAPFRARFRGMNRRAMRRAALVVANSRFMAETIRAFSDCDSLVVYPRTPVAPAPLPPGEAVGVVGDGADKGGTIVRALARAFPAVTFRLHARNARLDDAPPNLVAGPWETDPARLYAGLRLMLVPSQLREAYGRVSAEAQGFGVPALVSGIGGLPETVAGPAWVVTPHHSVAAWQAAFHAAWEQAPGVRDAVHAFACVRRREVDAQHQDLTARLLTLLDRAAP